MLSMVSFWLIFSYFLGSFPSGYIISRFSGEDILKIGWRKNSGSNVFKNVGIWQGILTGVLDVFKGYLAVYGAQRMDLGAQTQIFAGVATIVGHNWSIFLHFAGGRGVGTFIGGLLAFSPTILVLSLIPFLVIAAIWDAAIGTLIFFSFITVLSISLNQFHASGLFALISLVPIIIKRLSPVWEIRKSPEKLTLARNRLLFDDDKMHLSLRIRRFLEKK